MTVMVQSIQQIQQHNAPRLFRHSRRLAPFLTLAALVLAVPQAWPAVMQALSEVWLSVSVFVAGTLALVYAAERAFDTDLGQWLQRYQSWQVPVAALLGAFPGCGGAIVAMTHFSRGQLSFGAVVATLTATMGDAMFLLLAREPLTGFGVWLMGIAVGTVSGMLVDAVHGTGYLRPASVPHERRSSSKSLPSPALNALEKTWVMLAAVGFVVGLLAAFQVDIDHWLEPVLGLSPAYSLGLAGTLLALGLWIFDQDDATSPGCNSQSCVAAQSSEAQRIIKDTNFISAWVILAFVSYELVVSRFGLQLDSALAVWAPLVPLMAIAIGMIPGCGPQILVTSLYLSGNVPLSAQLGNAIANDGDALFPAIAVAPKAALIASIYSAIPALLVAYGWYFWVE